MKRAASSAAAKRKVVARGTTETSSPIPAPARVPGSSQNIRRCQARPRIIGPCFRCGEWGHLVANGAKPRQTYPFEQPLVREVVSNCA